MWSNVQIFWLSIVCPGSILKKSEKHQFYTNKAIQCSTVYNGEKLGGAAYMLTDRGLIMHSYICVLEYQKVGQTN